MTENWKECPFCGSKNGAIIADRKNHFVVCSGCKARGPEELSTDFARAKWNHRVMTEEVTSLLGKEKSEKEYFFEKAKLENFAWLKAIFELQSLRAKTRWIPVEERLPEEGVSVVALRDNGVVQIAQIKVGQWNIYFGKITHWTQLPPLPGEEVQR